MGLSLCVVTVKNVNGIANVGNHKNQFLCPLFLNHIVGGLDRDLETQRMDNSNSVRPDRLLCRQTRKRR